jgi:hypothetical protein
MASRSVSWVPGTHVYFGNLNFFITSEGELTRAPTPIQSPRSIDVDTIVEALEELWLHVPEVHAPGGVRRRFQL